MVDGIVSFKIYLFKKIEMAKLSISSPITAKGQGLLLCWYFIISSPEPLPIKKNDDEDSNKS
jgi:hypothetical protein